MGVISLLSGAFIPESPRWLISKGRYKKAFDVYQKIAKTNGKIFNDMTWTESREQAKSETQKDVIVNQ